MGTTREEPPESSSCRQGSHGGPPQESRRRRPPPPDPMAVGAGTSSGGRPSGRRILTGGAPRRALVGGAPPHGAGEIEREEREKNGAAPVRQGTCGGRRSEGARAGRPRCVTMALDLARERAVWPEIDEMTPCPRRQLPPNLDVPGLQPHARARSPGRSARAVLHALVPGGRQGQRRWCCSGQGPKALGLLDEMLVDAMQRDVMRRPSARICGCQQH